MVTEPFPPVASYEPFPPDGYWTFSSSCLLFWPFWQAHPPSCQWQCMASKQEYCTKSTVVLLVAASAKVSPWQSCTTVPAINILQQNHWLDHSTSNKHSSAKPLVGFVSWNLSWQCSVTRCSKSAMAINILQQNHWLVLLAESPMAVCSNKVQQIGHDMPKIKNVQCTVCQQSATEWQWWCAGIGGIAHGSVNGPWQCAVTRRSKSAMTCLK